MPQNKDSETIRRLTALSEIEPNPVAIEDAINQAKTAIAATSPAKKHFFNRGSTMRKRITIYGSTITAAAAVIVASVVMFHSPRLATAEERLAAISQAAREYDGWIKMELTDYEIKIDPPGVPAVIGDMALYQHPRKDQLVQCITHEGKRIIAMIDIPNKRRMEYREGNDYIEVINMTSEEVKMRLFDFTGAMNMLRMIEEMPDIDIESLSYERDGDSDCLTIEFRNNMIVSPNNSGKQAFVIWANPETNEIERITMTGDSMSLSLKASQAEKDFNDIYDFGVPRDLPMGETRTQAYAKNAEVPELIEQIKSATAWQPVSAMTIVRHSISEDDETFEPWFLTIGTENNNGYQETQYGMDREEKSLEPLFSIWNKIDVNTDLSLLKNISPTQQITIQDGIITFKNEWGEHRAREIAAYPPILMELSWRPFLCLGTRSLNDFQILLDSHTEHPTWLRLKITYKADSEYCTNRDEYLCWVDPDRSFLVMEMEWTSSYVSHQDDSSSQNKTHQRILAATQTETGQWIPTDVIAVFEGTMKSDINTRTTHYTYQYDISIAE